MHFSARAGRVGVSYSDHYAERASFERLMDRLRNMAPAKAGFSPVLATALRTFDVHKDLCPRKPRMNYNLARAQRAESREQLKENKNRGIEGESEFERRVTLRSGFYSRPPSCA